jgi:hypothetical protein
MYAADHSNAGSKGDHALKDRSIFRQQIDIKLFII